MQLRREKKKRENRSQSHNLTLMGEEKKNTFQNRTAYTEQICTFNKLSQKSLYGFFIALHQQHLVASLLGLTCSFPKKTFACSDFLLGLFLNKSSEAMPT